MCYIDWKDQRQKQLYIMDFEKKREWYEAHGKRLDHKTRKADFLSKNAFFETKMGYIRYLYTRDKDGFVVYSCHEIDDSKNKPGALERIKKECTGERARKIENKIFQDLNGCTPRKAFGYCDREMMHKCVPKQLYYIRDNMKLKVIKNCSEVDYSSHFPACMCGQMPRWQDHIEVSGQANPTPNYPFAFYVRSGHSAEYGGYDTRTWTAHRLAFNLFGENLSIIKPENDLTILCKASTIRYDSTMQYLYDLKYRGECVDGIEAKIVLNAAIGCKHYRDTSKKRNRLEHVATVTLCRAVKKMMDLYDQSGGRALMIVVDSMIYQGSDEIGDQSKRLGGLHQEVTGQDFIMRGINQYMFFDNGVCTKERHGAFNADIETSCPDDIKKWRKV